MSRSMLSAMLTVAILLLATPAAWAQGDQPPPPPPLGDTGDEPGSGLDPEPTPATPTPPLPHVVKPAAPTQNPEQPVVRAKGKNMGMFFRFGGLATMSMTGSSSTTTGALITNEIGIKFVFSEKFILPIFFGFGLLVTSPAADGAESMTDWNLGLGVGAEYHFRIWRRISPFIGGLFKFGFTDQDGDENLIFGLALGPQLGVEYYIADRVSLTASYLFLIAVGFKDGDAGGTTFGMGTKDQSVGSVTKTAVESGGNLTLTAYF